MINLTLKRGRTESLLRHHPWIFSGAIEMLDRHPQEGQLVKVLDSKGRVLGIGHYGMGSIAVRMLTFADETIDQTFWQRKLSQAFELRRQMGLVGNPHTSAYRLVHGEGDGLPGLVVDVYGTTAVMQAHSVGMHLVRNELAHALINATGGTISNVYYKSEGTLPRNWRSDGSETVGSGIVDGYLVGEKDCVLCTENDLRYEVDWLGGQKTGFFLDQRENRLLLRQMSNGSTVLNMFCYTGGFSVSALAGGATRVVSVDTSEKAIAQTERNVKLNFSSAVSHQAVCQDGFDFLEHTDEMFDIVVLDPPAFAKHRGALHNALKGYTRLNMLGLNHVKKGGLLFTFSCSQTVTKDHFRNAVLGAAVNAGRNATVLYQLHQPADHPVSLFHPEGEYLKGLVLRVD